MIATWGGLLRQMTKDASGDVVIQVDIVLTD